MKKLSILCAVAIAAIALAGCGDKDVKVLKNVTLFDGTGSAPVANSAIVVTHGRITWVGATDQVKVPWGATVIDEQGRFVMPGLIDDHVHLGNTKDLVQDPANYTRESVEKDLRQYASYGVTTVQSLGTDGTAIFALIKDQRATGRPSMARVYTAGQGLVFTGGYGGLPNLNRRVSTPAEAAAEVDRQAGLGADFIKLWLDDELGTLPKMPPEISQAIIDEAHKKGLRAVAHVFYLEDAKRLVDQGINGFAHMVRDQQIDQELIDKMKAHGTWQMACTLSREASMYAFGERPPFLDDPFFKQALSPAALAQLESAERQKTINTGPHYKDYMRFDQNALHNCKAMVDAGIPFAVGTDSGPPGRFAGYFMHWELEEMVKAGITPTQALTAATKSAAEFMGAKDIGTIQVGKWADLLVLDANPLDNILNTRRINSVFIAGNSAPVVKQGP